MSTPLGSHFRLTRDQSLKSKEEHDHMCKVPYASTVGSLIYLRKQHWETVKRVPRYLKGSSYTFLCFTRTDIKLQRYVDVDLVGDIDSRKSTTGFVYTQGGTAMSWSSNLQKTIALSTIEADYIGVSEVIEEMVWLQKFLEELGKKNE